MIDPSHTMKLHDQADSRIAELERELARAREAYDPIHLGMLYTARDNASPIYAASIDRAIRWIEQRSALTPAAETGNALTTYIQPYDASPKESVK
jgi:hypothetical protein